MQSYNFILIWFRTWESLPFFRFRATSIEARKNSEWVMAWPWASTKNFCASTDVTCEMKGGHLNGSLDLRVRKTILEEGSMVTSSQTELHPELCTPHDLIYSRAYSRSMMLCLPFSPVLSTRFPKSWLTRFRLLDFQHSSRFCNKHWIRVEKCSLVFELLPLLEMRTITGGSPWNSKHPTLLDLQMFFTSLWRYFLWLSRAHTKTNMSSSWHVLCIASTTPTHNSVFLLMSQPCFNWNNWNSSIDSSESRRI